MKKNQYRFNQLLVSVITLLTGTFVFSCATPKPPTGGEKDQRPPTLIRTEPKSGSTHFTADKIILEFTDKYTKTKEKSNGEKIKVTDPIYGTNIKLHNFKQQVLISPRNENVELEANAQKMTMIINIDGNFKPNTTYTISFPEIVSDNTENNKIKNFTYTFSTGDYLDTAYIKGVCKLTSTNKPIKDGSVMLYPVSDSLDITKHKPEYFTRTDESGSYTLKNLAKGNYQTYFINDKNGNLLLDKDEEVAFLDSAVTLDSLLKGIDFRVFLNDNEPPKPEMNNRKYHFILKFNEPLDTLIFTDTTGTPLELPLIVNQDKTSYSFHKSFTEDSITAQFIYKDANNNTDTSNYLIYHPNKEIIESENIDLQVLNKLINPKDTAKFSFIFPVSKIEPSRVHILYDSAEVSTLQSLKYSITQEELQIQINADTAKSIIVRFDSAALYGLDTNVINRKNDYTFTIADETQLGILSGIIEYEGEIFQMELLREGNVVKTTNKKSFRYTNMEPGTYSIQIKFDENKNGKYDTGDLERDIQPEKIFFHTTQIKLLPNWEIADIVVKPN